MVGTPSWMMLLLTLVTQGNGSDLLDYVQSSAYWRIQGVTPSVATMQAELAPARSADAAGLIEDLTGDDDAKRTAAKIRIRVLGDRAMPLLEKAAKAAHGNPDKAVVVQDLIGEVLKKPATGAARRLMAIRTLGEFKKTEALPTLQGLLTSKALFEADYARAAIAAIEGKPYTRPAPSAKTRAKDPLMLPADCGIVGQMTVPQGGNFDFDAAMKTMATMGGGQDPNQMLDMGTRTLLEAVERLGNVRVHSATLGIAHTIGSQEGFVVVLARGVYDTKAVARLIADKGRGETQTIDGVKVYWPGDKVALILPSNDTLVFVAGPGPQRHSRSSDEGADPAKPERPIAAAVQAMAKAVKTGAGSLDANGDLGKLIKSIDTAAPFWAVAKVSDAYRKGGPIIQPFETASLVGKPAKDGNAVELTLTAEGTDIVAITTAAQEFLKGLEEAKRELGQQAERMPAFKPMADFLGSIQVKLTAEKVTVTGRLQNSSTMMMIPMMFLGFRAGAASAPQGVAPQQVERTQSKVSSGVNH